jgi:hypothetical protein
VLLSKEDFDDTEMVQAARHALHWMFVDLAAQTREWNLTAQELQQLSTMSLRPKRDPHTRMPAPSTLQKDQNST